MGRDLYSPFDCAWLHRDAAAALEKVVAWLKVKRPGCKALVLDALRPQRVQEELWAALAGTDLQMYLADPARGSIDLATDITTEISTPPMANVAVQRHRQACVKTESWSISPC